METGAEKVVWDLSDLYATEELLKKDANEILERSKEFHETYHDVEALFKNPQETLKALKELEEIYSKMSRISQYVSLRFSADTSSEENKKLYAWAENVGNEVESNLLFIQIAFSKMNDDEFKRNIETLKDYKHFVESARKFRNHTLSEKEEQIIVYKNSTGSNAFVKFYTQLTSKYKFRMEIDGKTLTLNSSQLRSLRTHPDASVREKATSKLFKRYKKDALSIETAYNAVAKDYDFEAKLRNYPTPNSMRNLQNEVDDAVVDALVEVTTKNNSLVNRYYKLKAKLMKMKKLKLSDVYAPVGKTNKKFTWKEASTIVRQTFHSFHPTFGKIVDEFFDKNWIHAALKPSKSGGAFCSYADPKHHPYVLVNFTGEIRDVMTLGHELGHGVHGYLSRKQNILQYSTPLTMAETASTFAEMLLMDHFLETLPKKEIVPFVSSKIEDLFATMNRQNMFTRFERKAHQKISKEGASFEELSDIYEEELHLMFGDAVIYNPEFRWEWSSVPHFFHTPFYCYAYDFAQLMVLSLYQKYKEGMPNFKEKYIKLLESGGSDSPQNLLKPFGINLDDPNFWQGGFDFIRNTLLTKLEENI